MQLFITECTGVVEIVKHDRCQLPGFSEHPQRSEFPAPDHDLFPKEIAINLLLPLSPFEMFDRVYLEALVVREGLWTECALDGLHADLLDRGVVVGRIAYCWCNERG